MTSQISKDSEKNRIRFI